MVYIVHTATTTATTQAIDATSSLMPKGMLNFEAWFSGELLQMLEANSNGDVVCHAMQGCILSLVQSQWTELGPESFEKALVCAIKLIASPDLVMGLFSARLVEKLYQVVSLHVVPAQHSYARRRASETQHYTKSRNYRGSRDDEQKQCLACFELLKKYSVPCVQACFGLASRLEEVENLHTVLSLVSVQIELIETENTDIVSIVANHISELWNAVVRVSGGDINEASLNHIAQTDDAKNGRLHSCLIAVLIHLINKMGDIALQIDQVRHAAVLLIEFSTDLKRESSQYLLEDALHLLDCMLSHGSLSSIGQLIPKTIPKIIQIIEGNREIRLCMEILHSIFLLCGNDVLSLSRVITASSPVKIDTNENNMGDAGLFMLYQILDFSFKHIVEDNSVRNAITILEILDSLMMLSMVCK
jgi:hypothetical protein